MDGGWTVSLRSAQALWREGFLSSGSSWGLAFGIGSAVRYASPFEQSRCGHRMRIRPRFRPAGRRRSGGHVTLDRKRRVWIFSGLAFGAGWLACARIDGGERVVTRESGEPMPVRADLRSCRSPQGQVIYTDGLCPGEAPAPIRAGWAPAARSERWAPSSVSDRALPQGGAAPAQAGAR